MTFHFIFTSCSRLSVSLEQYQYLAIVWQGLWKSPTFVCWINGSCCNDHECIGARRLNNRLPLVIRQSLLDTLGHTGEASKRFDRNFLKIFDWQREMCPKPVNSLHCILTSIGAKTNWDHVELKRESSPHSKICSLINWWRMHKIFTEICFAKRTIPFFMLNQQTL